MNLLQQFWNSQSDMCPLEASQQEKQEISFQEWFDRTYVNKDWPDAIREKMIEKSEFYNEPKIYQYGYYDGYQIAKKILPAPPPNQSGESDAVGFEGLLDFIHKNDWQPSIDGHWYKEGEGLEASCWANNIEMVQLFLKSKL